MKFFGVIPSSPNRFFSIQFKDIRIQLGPDIRPVFTGGFLRVVRRFAPTFTLFVAAVFFLHCSKPTGNRWIDLKNTQAGVGGELVSQKGSFYQIGHASWYGGMGDGFEYKQTANGETMIPDAWTCAHPYLPFGTIVRVENLSNKLSTVLRVNDRGPYITGRIIDLSLRGANEIGIVNHGVAKVRVQVIQDLVRTSKIAITKKAEPKASPTNPTPTLENFDPSAIFVSLTGLVGKSAANFQQMLWKDLSAAVQRKEENIDRFKNRRFDPFINRKR